MDRREFFGWLGRLAGGATAVATGLIPVPDPHIPAGELILGDPEPEESFEDEVITWSEHWQGLEIGSDGTLYVGGEFTAMGGISVDKIATWNGSAWSAVGPDLDQDIIYRPQGSDWGLLEENT